MAIKTWVWVTMGVVVLGCVGLFTLAGAGMYLVMRDMKITSGSRTAVEPQFEEVLDRFRGQQALLEIGEDGALSREELDRRLRSYSGPLPEKLHLMAWEGKEQRVVRLSLPFWVLRLKSSSTTTLDLGGGRVERIHVDAAELAQAGPALVLDHHDGDRRVLLWTE